LPPGIKVHARETVVEIVAPDQIGLYRLSQRMPLGRALLGRRVGDVVPVTVQAGTVEFEILAIEQAAAPAAKANRSAQLWPPAGSR
jgi:transcription elongation GreA/GreB family factor